MEKPSQQPADTEPAKHDDARKQRQRGSQPGPAPADEHVVRARERARQHGQDSGTLAQQGEDPEPEFNDLTGRRSVPAGPHEAMPGRKPADREPPRRRPDREPPGREP